VFAEKLRALGQRTRPRDLYDVVNLYRRAELHGAREAVTAVLERKCAYKKRSNTSATWRLIGQLHTERFGKKLCQATLRY
jgi:predicted nucleotidyltransferase component of viral defense system